MRLDKRNVRALFSNRGEGYTKSASTEIDPLVDFIAGTVAGKYDYSHPYTCFILTRPSTGIAGILVAQPFDTSA